MSNSTKKYSVRHLVNWYYGNYCTRKCFDKEERLLRHGQWLQDFAKKHQNLMMTHKEFLDLFHNQMPLCALEEGFKKRPVFWKLFEKLLRIEEYDSDKVKAAGGKIGQEDKGVFKEFWETF